MEADAAAVAEPVKLFHRVRQPHVPQHVPPQHHTPVARTEAHVREPRGSVKPRRGVGGDVRGRERGHDVAGGAVDQPRRSDQVFADDRDPRRRRIEGSTARSLKHVRAAVLHVGNVPELHLGGRARQREGFIAARR